MLELKSVTTSLGGMDIISDISFSLDKGDNISIIGPNGSGKTTLLKTIAGLLNFGGDIHYNGKSIKNNKPKELAKIFGVLSQKQSLHFGYTVFDMVMMGRFVHRQGLFHNSSTDKKIVMEILDIVGLSHISDVNIRNLSGGQVQRVHLAAVIAQQPQVILLDELTNHLDIKYQIELIQFLKEWAKDKILIGVFHDINMAMHMSDKMLLLNNGKIVSMGSNENVLPLLNDVYTFNIADFMVQSLKKWR